MQTTLWEPRALAGLLEMLCLDDLTEDRGQVGRARLSLCRHTGHVTEGGAGAEW